MESSEESEQMIRFILCSNSILVLILVFLFYLYPIGRGLLSMHDRALSGPGIPKVAWRLYRNLTPCYAQWAKDRVTRGSAAGLSTENISGTEWPLFGSVFYLWAMENLQEAWDKGDHTAGREPRVFGRTAIEAASELVIDPNHATWVQKHWGTNYLTKENVFYRMLVISALTSREKLLHDRAHLAMLREQVDSFSQELDSSHSGLLDDYPEQCYPGDVMAAVAAIRRADAVLGSDHTTFVQRELRAFTGGKNNRLEVPPYSAAARDGTVIEEARGCGNAYVLLTSPELWPDQAKIWLERQDRSFWQERLAFRGYREFAKDVPGREWYMDVDAGPVLAGFGVSACAFGVGGARKCGRFDRAYPLSAEMLVTSWELPNGVLAGPRLLSNATDAPLLGEAAILWLLTVQPQAGFPNTGGGPVPGFIFLFFGPVLVLGAWRVWAAIRCLQRAYRSVEPVVPRPSLQTAIWIGCLAIAVAFLWTHFWWVGLLFLIAALALPIRPTAKSAQSRE
jgi:hypothetical protein